MYVSLLKNWSCKISILVHLWGMRSVRCADASWLAGGDATIFECEQSSSTEDEDGTCGGSKRAKVIDMNRTGAKSAAGEQEDPKGAGAGYHSLGVLRTKVDAYLQADGQAKKTERESVCVCVCV